MYELLAMVKRNILVFLRDKSAVFFSFLSVIILLAIYSLVLGGQYVSDANFYPFIVSDNLKFYLEIGIIMGGALVINTVSLSLGVMGNIVNDLENRNIDGFLVTPVRRYKIVLSYYLTAVIVAAILTILMWILLILYVGIFSTYWYSFLVIIKVVGLIVFFTLISTALMVFLTMFINSTSLFGAVTGLIGTIIGFTSGIYFPIVQFGKGLTNFASLSPFTHMTIMLRSIILERPFELLVEQTGLNFDYGENVEVPNIKEIYGMTEIGVLGRDINIWLVLALFSVISVLLLVVAYRRMIKKIVK